MMRPSRGTREGVGLTIEAGRDDTTEDGSSDASASVDMTREGHRPDVVSSREAGRAEEDCHGRPRIDA
jgi:hypothetical protein